MHMSNQTLKRYTQFTISLAFFFVPFMGGSLNLALPAISKEFASNVYLLSWVTTGYILASAAFLIPFGRVADIRGKRRLFAWGIGLLTFSALLCGLAWSMEALIFFRILQGIGASMIFATGMAILTSVFPPEERGKILGINAAFVYGGHSMAPFLGGNLTHYFGWRSIFFFMFLAGIFITYLAFFKPKAQWIQTQNETFDMLGATLYTLGIIFSMFGLMSIVKWSGAKYILILGLLVLVLFFRRALLVAQPIFNVSLFTQNTTFAFSNLAALINYSAAFAISFLLSLYLQVGRGFDPRTAGLILLAQPIIMAVCSPFSGRLSDKIEPRIIATSGMALTAVGLFFLSFLKIDTPLGYIILNQALVGIGFSLFGAPNNNAIMSSVQPKFFGVASSTIGTMRLTGQAISMSLVTLIITLVAGNIDLSPVHADLLLKSCQVAFLVFAINCFLGIFASLARGTIQDDKEALVTNK